jgi:hypothetical protein
VIDTTSLVVENAKMSGFRFELKLKLQVKSKAMADKKKPIRSLSFSKIIATVGCPWSVCYAARGVACSDRFGVRKEIPHKSRFKAAVKELELNHGQ